MKTQNENVTINKDDLQIESTVTEIFKQEFGPTLVISKSALNMLIDAYKSFIKEKSSVPSANDLLDKVDEENNFIWNLDVRENYISHLPKDKEHKEDDSGIGELIKNLETIDESLQNTRRNYRKLKAFSISLIIFMILSFAVTCNVLGKKVR